MASEKFGNRTFGTFGTFWNFCKRRKQETTDKHNNEK